MSGDPTSVHFLRRSAGSAEQIRSILSSDFGNARFEIDPEGRRSGAHARATCAFGGIRIDQTECVGGRFIAEPRSLHIDVTVRGAMSVKSAQCEVATASEPMVTWAPPNEQIIVLTKPGTLIFSLRIQPDSVAHAGRTMYGQSFRLPSRPTGPQPPGLGAILTRNLRHVFYELSELEKSGLSALALPPFRDLLTGLALAIIRPDLLASDMPAQNEPPWLVSRAEEILHDRAPEPLSITEVAEELGVTVRTLQLAFRRQRGCTPLQFLINRRMALARTRLLNPEPRANVQSIVMGCGIANLGRFAARYRATYGEMPSETLARGRRI